MSLTGHLRDPSSTIRAWFVLRLPETAPLAREANHELRRRPGTSTEAARETDLASTPSLPSTAVSPQLIGTALDLLVRATLAPRRPAVLPTIGALRVAESGIWDAPAVASETGARLARLQPATLAPDAAAWRQVASLCILLARFEQSGRSRQASETMVHRLAAAEPSVESYIAALVDARDVHDVAIAAPAITADHADLLDAHPVLGPTFALSTALGGADADLVADGLLLDLKASVTPRIVGRPALWQLAGYALADTPDEHHIRRVGISALRWRQRWIVSLDYLLASLAGRSVNVPDLRDEFSAVVKAAGRSSDAVRPRDRR